jgi:hypothetical protein
VRGRTDNTMAKRYHRGNQKPLEEEQTIQWIKYTREVIRSREDEQIIQWLNDTTELIRSCEEEQTIQWLKDTTEVTRSVRGRTDNTMAKRYHRGNQKP